MNRDNLKSVLKNNTLLLILVVFLNALFNRKDNNLIALMTLSYIVAFTLYCLFYYNEVRRIIIDAFKFLKAYLPLLRTKTPGVVVNIAKEIVNDSNLLISDIKWIKSYIMKGFEKDFQDEVNVIQKSRSDQKVKNPKYQISSIDLIKFLLTGEQNSPLLEWMMTIGIQQGSRRKALALILLKNAKVGLRLSSSYYQVIYKYLLSTDENLKRLILKDEGLFKTEIKYLFKENVSQKLKNLAIEWGQITKSIHKLENIKRSLFSNEDWKKIENAYLDLEIGFFAGDKTVKRSFNLEAKERHPDFASNNSNMSETEWRKINERFSYLRENYKIARGSVHKIKLLRKPIEDELSFLMVA